MRLHAHPAFGLREIAPNEWPHARSDAQFEGEWATLDDDERERREHTFFGRLLGLLATRWSDASYRADLPYPGQAERLQGIDTDSTAPATSVVHGRLTSGTARAISELAPEVIEVTADSRQLLYGHGGWSAIGLDLTVAEASEFEQGLGSPET
jgi:hypothetical protein